MITRFDGQQVTRLEMVQIDQGARIDASLAAFHVSSLEGDRPGDHAAPDGEAGGEIEIGAETGSCNRG